MTCAILLAVDGSDCALRAARHVASLYGGGTGRAPRIHLLNVQSPGDDWMLRRQYPAEELQRLQHTWGEAALAPAQALLEAAGLECECHVRQGAVAQTIAQYAREAGCAQIVMGSRGLGAIGGMLMGSVAMKVLYLADVPVTLVK